MLKSLGTMDEIDRRRLSHALMWLLAAVVLTLGSEFSHWWRHRWDAAAARPAAATGMNSVVH
jgi:hypothetical protein